MLEEHKSMGQMIDELPGAVSDYFFDSANVGLNDTIFDRNSISIKDEPKVLELMRRLIVKELSCARLADEIMTKLGLDEAKAKKLAMDIAGYRLLPLNGFLGDIDGYIRSLGGNPDDYPETRIQVEERTTDAAVKDVATGVELGQLPHRLKSRFEDAVRSYFKGVRTGSQLMDILTREEKIGGVGLSPEDAAKVLAEAEEERKTAFIDDTPTEKEEPAMHADTSGSGAQGTHQEDHGGQVSSSATKPKPTFVTVLPEDEDEIEEIRQNLPKEATTKSVNTDEKIKASVEEIYKAAGVGAASSEALQNRFRKIIENRLRDIRDPLETLETLVQPKELGGMSLSQEDARHILSLIEDKLKAVHDTHQEDVKEKKASWVSDEARKSIERDETEKNSDRMARDEAFRQATSRSKKLTTISGQGIVSATPPAHPMPPPNLPIPSGNASAPVPPILPQPNPRPRTLTLPGRPVPATSSVANQPPMTPARPSVMPLPIRRPEMKPIMTDVKSSAPMATGPVEDLRTTSLEDFRRLSKDPKEAILKIRDKIDLLGEESFTKRSQGIVAWSRSGVYRLYMDMMGEALQGKTMEEVMADRRAENKPCLTREEIAAVVQLGIALRA